METECAEMILVHQLRGPVCLSKLFGTAIYQLGNLKESHLASLNLIFSVNQMRIMKVPTS